MVNRGTYRPAEVLLAAPDAILLMAESSGWSERIECLAP
jgi:hypothetical protein